MDAPELENDDNDPSAMWWFQQPHHSKEGPVTYAVLKHLAQTTALQPDAKVWHGADASPLSTDQIPGLAAMNSTTTVSENPYQAGNNDVSDLDKPQQNELTTDLIDAIARAKRACLLFIVACIILEAAIGLRILHEAYFHLHRVSLSQGIIFLKASISLFFIVSIVGFYAFSLSRIKRRPNRFGLLACLRANRRTWIAMLLAGSLIVLIIAQ